MVLLAAIPPGMPGGGPVVVSPLLLIVAAILAAVLVLRRVWPLPVHGVVLAIAIAATVLSAMPLASTVALAISIYAVAAGSSRRVAVLVAVTSALLVLAANAVAADGDLLEPRVYIAPLVVLTSAAIGDSTRSRRAYLQAVLDRARRAEETREAEARRRVAEERLRIARDLHDAVGHRMTVINLHAGVAGALLRDDPAEAERSVDTIGDAARSVLTDIHDLLRVLRMDGQTGVSAPIGMAAAPDLIADIEATGTRVALRRTGDGPAPDAAVDEVAFRVLQEALTNAARHGGGGVIDVEIHTDQHRLTITTSNTVEASKTTQSGHGLLGMRERVESVGGAMHVGGTRSGRFELTVVLPLTTADTVAAT